MCKSNPIRYAPAPATILLMPPQSPAPNQSDPYGFILAPQPKKAAFSFNLSGGSMKKRIILIAGVFVILTIITMIAGSFLGQSNQAHQQALTELAGTQTEIVRLSTVGAAKATDPQTQALAINTQLSTESDRQATIAALQKRGVKVNAKTLASAKNPKSDTLLTQAASNNDFDQAFEELIQAKLSSYQKQLKSVYGSGTSSEKKTFAAMYSSVSLLLPKSAGQK